MVVLRPVPGERREYVQQRLAGTLTGALIALVVVWVLPQDLLLVAAFVFLVVLAAYAMSGNYFMQTMFLTPMLLLFLSAGGETEVTVVTDAGPRGLHRDRRHPRRRARMGHGALGRALGTHRHRDAHLSGAIGPRRLSTRGSPSGS